MSRYILHTHINPVSRWFCFLGGGKEQELFAGFCCDKVEINKFTAFSLLPHSTPDTGISFSSAQAAAAASSAISSSNRIYLFIGAAKYSGSYELWLFVDYYSFLLRATDRPQILTPNNFTDSPKRSYCHQFQLNSDSSPLNPQTKDCLLMAIKNVLNK